MLLAACRAAAFRRSAVRKKLLTSNARPTKILTTITSKKYTATAGKVSPRMLSTCGGTSACRVVWWVVAAAAAAGPSKQASTVCFSSGGLLRRSTLWYNNPCVYRMSCVYVCIIQYSMRMCLCTCVRMRGCVSSTYLPERQSTPLPHQPGAIGGTTQEGD